MDVSVYVNTLNGILRMSSESPVYLNFKLHR
jgi:hypothetical protein